MSHFQTSNVIFESGGALNLDYRRDLFVEREELLDEYITRLEPVLQGRSPENIFVDGEPGTGKTSTTRYALDLLEAEMEEQDLTFTSTHVTASQDSTSFQLLIKVTNEFRERHGQEPLSMTGYSYDQVSSKLRTELGKLSGAVYVVIDEIDEITNPDQVLTDLSRLSERDTLSNLRLGLIVIGNDGNVVQHLDQSTVSSLQPSRVSFPPFKTSEIESVLRKRAEVALVDGVLDDKILKLCSAAAADAGGDIRDAIELLNQAGEMARVRIRNAEDSEHQPERILEGDVRDARDEMTPTWVQDTIQNLSNTKNQIVFSIIRLAVKRETPSRTSEIHHYHSTQFPDSSISERRCREFLQRLHERGLLHRSPTNNGQDDTDPGQYDEYGLRINLVEVLDALKTTSFDWYSEELVENLTEEALDNGVVSESEKERIVTA